MKSKTVDHINIWLLIISFMVAIYLPFELFLFSYAFFGPLHYLTEINWLNDKKYFIKSKSQANKIFIVFAIIIAIFPLIKYLGFTGRFQSLIDYLGPKKNIILLSGFIFSVCLIFISKIKQLILGLILTVLFSIVVNLYVPKIIIVIGVFLPTLIHVYVFTLLFMIYGQLKSRSRAGVTSILLLIIAPLFIVFLKIEPSVYLLSEYTQNTFLKGNLISVNKSVASLFGVIAKENLYELSSIAVKIQIFIAFAYTYHYLNWFSKTSIIGWKSSLTSIRMKYIIVLWLCAVGLFLYDYVTGLIALFFLSLLHVVLEFPLNVTTIKELILVGVKRLNSGSK